MDVYQDKANWVQVLSDVGEHDFGHTYDFHAASHDNGDGIPILFAVRNGGGRAIMCWPALLRRIDGFDLFDLNGAYGYSGPLIGRPELASGCLEPIYDAMRNMGVVAVFAKIHPLFVSRFVRMDLPLEHSHDAVVIDLRRQSETIRSYNTNHRRDIKKALACGVSTVMDEQCKRLDVFKKIYDRTMEDLSARDESYFSIDYLAALAKATDFKASLIFARFEGMDIGSIMIIRTGSILHYHLGGVDRTFLELSPLKIMLARAHQVAIEEGASWFFLGGGPGGFGNPLVRFKQGFSKLTYPFCVHKKIVDPIRYVEVCRAKGVDPEGSDFIPAYRAPL